MPPLVGVAVKVTDVPEHTGLADAAIDTLTGTVGSTVIVTVLDVAGLPVAQVLFEVSIQVTASVFTGIYENVELLVPAFTPFTFH